VDVSLDVLLVVGVPALVAVLPVVEVSLGELGVPEPHLSANPAISVNRTNEPTDAKTIFDMVWPLHEREAHDRFRSELPCHHAGLSFGILPVDLLRLTRGVADGIARPLGVWHTRPRRDCR